MSSQQQQKKIKFGRNRNSKAEKEREIMRDLFTYQSVRRLQLISFLSFYQKLRYGLYRPARLRHILHILLLPVPSLSSFI